MERDLLISLVTKAQKGDSTAMDELFANFYNDVYYFALKTVKDSDTACDITQETFLEIINTIGNLKEPAAFVTWMKQITYHQCTRYFKKKKDVLVEEDEDGNTIFDTLADESEGSIPYEVYEKEEFRNTILGIINEQTEEQRSAVMMYYFDELTVAQIAKIQGVSEGTVKSRLNYARKAIKKSVESYEKKHNIKLHSFSFLPLFLLFFGKELMPTAKAAEVGAVVSETASAVATGSAVVGGTTAVVSAEATVATAGTGIAAKIAAMPLVTKIIAGIVAVSVAVGGGVALLGNHNNGDQIEDCVDVNHDCICDVCSAGIHFINGERYAGKVAHDAVCDYCGTDLGFYDEDMDNICDECGEYPCGDFHHVGHLDGDSDGICEWCSASDNSGDIGEQAGGTELSQLLPPFAVLVDGTIYIRPAVVNTEEGTPAFDTTEAVYEIYNLDTGELACTRSRAEFTLTNSEETTLNEVVASMLKIHISEITDALTCRIGIKAVSEGYADSALWCLEYVAASEMKSLDVSIDADGILHIGNYNENCMYKLFIDDNIGGIVLEAPDFDLFRYFNSPWCEVKPNAKSSELHIYEIRCGGELFKVDDRYANSYFGQVYGENDVTVKYYESQIERSPSELDFEEPFEG